MAFNDPICREMIESDANRGSDQDKDNRQHRACGTPSRGQFNHARSRSPSVVAAQRASRVGLPPDGQSPVNSAGYHSSMCCVAELAGACALACVLRRSRERSSRNRGRSRGGLLHDDRNVRIDRQAFVRDAARIERPAHHRDILLLGEPPGWSGRRTQYQSRRTGQMNRRWTDKRAGVRRECAAQLETRWHRVSRPAPETDRETRSRAACPTLSSEFWRLYAAAIAGLPRCRQLPIRTSCVHRFVLRQITCKSIRLFSNTQPSTSKSLQPRSTIAT